MEKLRQWLKDKKMKQKDFAERLGVSENYVSLLLRGERKGSPELALEIERVTEKAVTIYDIFGGA